MVNWKLRPNNLNRLGSFETKQELSNRYRLVSFESKPVLSKNLEECEI